MTLTKLKVLISNDDGVHAPGIQALAQAVAEVADVYVVAPSRERSGQSHSVTTTRPLRIVELDAPGKIQCMLEVDGKPADCVKFAVTSMPGFKPDLVISGINRGGNMAEDTLYSGTVGAALEATLYGYPSMAFSLHHFETWHLDTQMYTEAAKSALQLVELFARRPWGVQEEGLKCLNVNIPAIPFVDVKGVRHADVGKRFFQECFVKKTDPRGADYYWLDFGPHSFDTEMTAEVNLVRAGYVAVTPLRPSLQDHARQATLEQWLTP
ncbi:MAG: 5'/3'-nucleotidase SurE [Zetaproteobacteria bacterium]|nr:5'/3'-nucleotidase SurE [Zetaproteobacteria bacterium]